VANATTEGAPTPPSTSRTGRARRLRGPVRPHGRLSWLVRHLELPPSDYPREHRGFIAIQIDGLGYYVLKGALTRRYTPFLRKLVKRRGYRLYRYRVGLPATTPASQLGILYGANDDVPGFRWLEKDSRTLNITKSANVCAAVEQCIRARSPEGGVLRHGSSYCNMFSGDAKESTLTLSTLGRGRGAPLRWSSLLSFFVLWMGLLLRIIGLSLWEALLELYDQLRALQAGRLMRDEGVFPIVRAVTNVVFREIATEGCLHDIYRGVPFVYLNFSGYDEVAHHRGPNSAYAKLVLRGIDHQVRRICRATERYADRAYDVVLLSDHGQSTTIPWEHLHKQSLTEFLLERLAVQRLQPLGADHRAKQVGRSLAFTAWLKELEWMLPRGLSHVVKYLSTLMAERLPDEAADVDWVTDADVLVAPTGSLAHVYFTSIAEPLTLAEVEARHPRLVASLIEHPSIACVAARGEDGAVRILSKEGTLELLADGTERREGVHPLDRFLDHDELTAEVARLSRMRHAGDLILFSARDRAGRVVNFQVEMGSHGGLHVDEQAGFIMLHDSVDFDVASVRSVRDLYKLFSGYHRQAPPA
jgi:hypothetical protein